MALRPTRNTGEAFRAAGALSTVGIAFVFALMIGFWIGSRLDRWLNTAPWFTIVFFFLGLAAGIQNVIRTVSQAFPTRSTDKPAAGGPAAPEPGESAGPSDRELFNGDK